MIIRSLRQHWPARKLEWLMAGFLTCWGLYVLLHPQMFTNPPTEELMSGMAHISSSFTVYPALFWGGSSFVVGLARAVALFVNGSWTRTPLIRLLASFASMFIVTQIVAGLWQSGVPNTGLVVYPWLIVADLLSAYRAAVDVVHAEKQREDDREPTSADEQRHSRRRVGISA
jgi:hypothetical protein